MSTLLPEVLRHLEALVGFDTRNPPREIGTGGIFDYLRAQLPGFAVRVTDHGAGAVSMLAVRGNPKRVFNVHLDTVPSSPAWSADPHVLRIEGDRAIGLGACDIKGAAACLITAAEQTQGDAAFLFTTDEEANDPRCIAAFLAGMHGFEEAIVAEPTQGEAVLAHRGISSVLMRFQGQAGHASGADAFSLSVPRNPSISSGVAEASQAAPDFSSGLVKVECPSGPDVAGDLLAELVNFSPFLQHCQSRRAKIADRRLCRFRLDLI